MIEFKPEATHPDNVRFKSYCTTQYRQLNWLYAVLRSKRMNILEGFITAYYLNTQSL